MRYFLDYNIYLKMFCLHSPDIERYFNSKRQAYSFTKDKRIMRKIKRKNKKAIKEFF